MTIYLNLYVIKCDKRRHNQPIKRERHPFYWMRNVGISLVYASYNRPATCVWLLYRMVSVCVMGRERGRYSHIATAHANAYWTAQHWKSSSCETSESNLFRKFMCVYVRKRERERVGKAIATYSTIGVYHWLLLNMRRYLAQKKLLHWESVAQRVGTCRRHSTIQIWRMWTLHVEYNRVRERNMKRSN